MLKNGNKLDNGYFTSEMKYRFVELRLFYIFEFKTPLLHAVFSESTQFSMKTLR